eukprot:TRINITY_DN19510_c0_g1_i1.p1 TRINITY_DN19510_c0_g1~~TRINITY_DN19510_c0_g1_i1.p1  ORF type:complete len:169 (-),score=30.00 TRINITY_DN19510_c0_g1_i1:320-826(-)
MSVIAFDFDKEIVHDVRNVRSVKGKGLGGASTKIIMNDVKKSSATSKSSTGATSRLSGATSKFEPTLKSSEATSKSLQNPTKTKTSSGTTRKPLGNVTNQNVPVMSPKETLVMKKHVSIVPTSSSTKKQKAKGPVDYEPELCKRVKLTREQKVKIYGVGMDPGRNFKI